MKSLKNVEKKASGFIIVLLCLGFLWAADDIKESNNTAVAKSIKNYQYSMMMDE